MTWSLDHGVSWFSWLFIDHVNPEPDSETINPKFGFATTLTHGSGVVSLFRRTTTYSRPEFANPPNPLKCCLGGTSKGTSGYCGRRTGAMAETETALSSWRARLICSASVPRLLSSTTRAAACSCALVLG